MTVFKASKDLKKLQEAVPALVLSASCAYLTYGQLVVAEYWGTSGTAIRIPNSTNFYLLTEENFQEMVSYINETYIDPTDRREPQ